MARRVWNVSKDEGMRGSGGRYAVTLVDGEKVSAIVRIIFDRIRSARIFDLVEKVVFMVELSIVWELIRRVRRSLICIEINDVFV